MAATDASFSGVAQSSPESMYGAGVKRHQPPFGALPPFATSCLSLSRRKPKKKRDCLDREGYHAGLDRPDSRGREPPKTADIWTVELRREAGVAGNPAQDHG